ncbi:MAG: Stp1/IreP family PP2C-type Ser/Thr phosphatase [Coriobacteriales bacterium]|nr:Stp1/IreP family PP2C-type Ser/Thr phosphatase [Coriobacteriales bacterium]
MSPRGATWYATHSEIGRVRDHNEDAVLAEPPLFVVADGLGGHEAGEVASSLAVATLRDHAPRRPDAKALARAVRAANREVIRAAREGIGRQGMGTTMTAAIVEGSRIAIAHVGDSRAYLLRDGTIRRLTEDHSMVADMVRRGTITEEESRYHPNRSVITRALGTDANMVADTYEVDAEPGDILLLASDGLTGMVEDPDIAAIVARTSDDLQVAAKALAEAANAAGGHDNISVVLARISGTPGKNSVAPAKKSASLPSGRTVLAVFGWLLAFALIVAGIGYATYRYAYSQAYLTAENGVIVAYRGVPGSFAGITLSWPLETTDIQVSELPMATGARIQETLRVGSAEEALALIEQYRSEVQTDTPLNPPVVPDPRSVPNQP